MAGWIDFSDLVEKAEELIDIGLFDEAKALLDLHSASFSGEWELHFLYSRCFAEQNRPGEAIPWLLKGLRLSPMNIDCLVGLFYAYAMTRRMSKAKEYLLQAEKYHPDHDLVLCAFIWYHAETNDLDAAISCFERLRSKGTDNPEAFRNAGIAYDRAGFGDKAAECFTTALELFPEYDEARELLADLYVAAGKPAAATELYRQALSASPHNIRYLSRLSFYLAENKEAGKAMETAETTARLYPNSPIGHIDLAYLHMNAGALDKARAAAEKALDIAPLDAESRRARAIILSEQGDHDEAEVEFEKALSLDPDNTDIIRDYYHHFRRTGDYDLMEKLALRAMERNDPSCVEDCWFLADYYREKGELLTSLQYLRKAYRIRPGEHELLSLAADILIAAGHPRLSLRFLKRYVERAGWNEVAELLASSPELKKGRMREALRFIRFCAGSPADYCRVAFAGRLRRAAAAAAVAVLAAACVPMAVLFGAAGPAFIAVAALTAWGAIYLVKLLRKRKTPPLHPFPEARGGA